MTRRDVGRGPKDGVVHRMGGDLERESGVIVTTTISRIQLLGPLAVLPWFAGEE
jgi:hypothetical protein